MLLHVWLRQRKGLMWESMYLLHDALVAKHLQHPANLLIIALQLCWFVVAIILRCKRATIVAVLVGAVLVQIMSPAASLSLVSDCS